MKKGRHHNSPYTYDRAVVRKYVEQHGRAAALAKWPKDVVDPIARMLGVMKPYRVNGYQAVTPERVHQLGTKPDHRLAAEWGLPTGTVAKARHLLGITALGRRPDVELRREQLAAVADDDFARLDLSQLYLKTKIPIASLSAERRRRGIVKTRGRGRRRSGGDITNEMRMVAIGAIRMAFPYITLEELGGVLGVTREYVRILGERMTVELTPTVIEPTKIPKWQYNRKMVQTALYIAQAVTEEFARYDHLDPAELRKTLPRFATKAVYQRALYVISGLEDQ